MKKSVITRFASTVLAILTLACLCVPASALDLDFFSCGIQAHRHSSSCYDGGLFSLLAANGLQDLDEAIYVIHQHVDACYGAGGCPLEDPAAMAEHPNVKVLHQHDGNCRPCGLEDTPYRIAGTEGAYEEVPAGEGASADGGYDPEHFVVGVPGGLKDTGETTSGTEDGSMYIMEPHVHGPGCGGSCGKPIVLVYEGDGASRLICGLEEHSHGASCVVREASLVKKMARQAPLSEAIGENQATKENGVTGKDETTGEVVALMNAEQQNGGISGGVLPNTGGTGITPFYAIGIIMIAAGLGVLKAGRRRNDNDKDKDKGKDEK